MPFEIGDIILNTETGEEKTIKKVIVGNGGITYECSDGERITISDSDDVFGAVWIKYSVAQGRKTRKSKRRRQSKRKQSKRRQSKRRRR